MKTFKIITLCASMYFLVASAYAQSPDALFMQNCAACHSIGNGRLVGPDLKNITDSRKEDWLLKWIKSSQSFIKTGDTAAKNIYTQFSSIPMPDQLLTDAQIKSIIGYIKSQSTTQVAQTDTVPVTTAQASVTTGNTSTASATKFEDLISPDTFFRWLWLGLIVTFILVIVSVLSSAMRSLSDALKDTLKK